MSDWPVWATEKIDIIAPDIVWAARGEQERSRLVTLLGPWLASAIHHIGSTAVPGLAAKPILDLMAGVADLDHSEEIAAVLAPHSWHYVPPELDGRPERRFLVKVVEDRRVAHLHLVIPDQGRWRDQLRFRDRLRADPSLRDEYGRLKRRLAAEYVDDREAYTRAKATFVRRALADSEDRSL